MIQVVDASVVVAALVDDSPTGRWCEDALQQGDLAAPQLMPFEATNVIRRLVAHAALAVDDLRRLPVELAPYELLAARIWELRDNSRRTTRRTSPPPRWWEPGSSPSTPSSPAAPAPTCQITTPP